MGDLRAFSKPHWFVESSAKTSSGRNPVSTGATLTRIHVDHHRKRMLKGRVLELLALLTCEDLFTVLCFCKPFCRLNWDMGYAIAPKDT